MELLPYNLFVGFFYGFDICVGEGPLYEVNNRLVFRAPCLIVVLEHATSWDYVQMACGVLFCANVEIDLYELHAYDTHYCLHACQ